MTANLKASTTMLWLKQLTTSTFSSINQRVDRIAFFRRNKKTFGIVTLCWCVAIIGTFLLFDTLESNGRHAFLNDAAAVAVNMANQAAPLLLEDD
ncbi:MAG: hypothetical protein HKP58_18525, partial [Desulfatitalea sp.]|nr:hypothetical protein [Desulfatitalea sp.]NNK02413.1 hypothetical protein [Desulfatitalea sp.]